MDRGIKKPKKEFITIKEACKKFKENRWSLRKKIDHYKIENYKVGRQTFVRLSDLEKLYKPVVYNINLQRNDIKKPIPIRKQQQRIKITLTCNFFRETEFFLAYDIDKQVKWLEGHRNKFEQIHRKIYFQKHKKRYRYIKGKSCKLTTDDKLICVISKH